MQATKATRRSPAWLATAMVALTALGASAIAGAQTLGEPDVSGDQLIFIYDARSGRVSFLNVANPSDDTVVLDVRLYNEDFSSVVSSVITLEAAENTVIDPTSFAGGGANGQAGLAVVTPVVAADNLQPVVPPQPLTGGFTLANTNLGSGFGQNPFARLAVNGSGTPQAPGTAVDGSSVFYERFAPDVLTIPVYFNPADLGPPEDDGNRVLMAAFMDGYAASGFTISAMSTSTAASFFSNGGVRIATNTVEFTGGLFSNLQEVAGTNIDGQSGKVFFDVDAGNGNIFGAFSQSISTFAAAQRMPAVASIPTGKDLGPVLDCPGGTATITGNLDSSIRWPASCEILIDGTIFVNDGVTLTIEKGTTIKGKRFPDNPPPTALVFRQGSKINAVGTADEPIVFTSDQPAGSRAPGDWAGLAFNGRAPANCQGGVCEAEGLVDTVFGGDDSADSSGTIRYVRVEYAGRELSPDNELNVFTLNGIGNGTTVEYVQAHMGLDDGIEWFGGTVNGRWLVSTGAADDLFDWQVGYVGANQFLYGAHTGNNIDTSGSRGFEGDNNGDGNDFEPRSDPKMCNVTLIGSKGQAGGDVSNRGLLLRDGTTAKIAQAIVTQFNTAGVQMRDPATADQACTNDGTATGALLVADSTFWNVGEDGMVYAQDHESTAGANCSTTGLFAQWQSNDGVVTTDPGLPASCASMGCQPIPTGDVSSDYNCSSLDAFLMDQGYMGAFAPGQESWATGNWINFDEN